MLNLKPKPASQEPHIGTVDACLKEIRAVLQSEENVRGIVSPPLNTEELRRDIRAATRSELARIKKSPVENAPDVPLNQINVTTINLDGSKHCNAGCSQDAIAVAKRDDLLVVALSDGASSCQHSELGAKLITIIAQEVSCKVIENYKGKSLLSVDVLSDLYIEILSRLSECLDTLEVDVACAHELFLAGTLQLAIATPNETILLGISDGYISLGDRYESCADITDRNAALTLSNFAPTVSTALLFFRESDLIARTAVSAESLINTTMTDIIRHDVMTLRVLEYGSTADLVSARVGIFSDGIEYTDLPFPLVDCEGYFPLREALVKVGAGDIRDLGHFWNWAADKATSLGDRTELLREVNESMNKYDMKAGVSDPMSLREIKDDVSGVILDLQLSK